MAARSAPAWPPGRFGEIYYTAVLWTAEEIPIPSPADAGYLLFPPLMLAGVVALLRRAHARASPRMLWADGPHRRARRLGASAPRSSSSRCSAARPGSALAVALGLAYPLADLVLLGVIVGALAGTGWRLDRTWVLLAAGVAAFWLADSLYLVGRRRAAPTSPARGSTRLVARPGPDRLRRPGSRPRPSAAARPTSALRLIVVPLGFGTVGLGAARLRLPRRTLNAAGGRAGRRVAGRRDGPARS